MAPAPSPWANTTSTLPPGNPWGCSSKHSPITPARWTSPQGDIQSTSTVTESAGSSDSERSSADDHSPRSSPGVEQHRPAFRWHTDEYDADDDLLAPISRHTLSGNGPPSSRSTLPRCGVLNFRKEGENLRWAPRVTENRGGVAARVHNFEDAFSLEEFSSRALPGVWQSTGGNPRLSSATEDSKSKGNITGKKTPTPDKLIKPLQSSSEKRYGDHSDRSSRSGFGSSQKSIVKSSSFKRSMALAQEMRRPSFWSVLAHNSKYRKAKAQARLQNEGRRPSERVAPDRGNRSVKKSTWAAVINAVIKRTATSGPSNNETSSKGRKGLFRRLVDRRNAREKGSNEDSSSARGEDRLDASEGTDDRTGALRMRRRHIIRQSVDLSRGEDSPSGRRIRSSISSTAKKEKVAVGAQDDQYVTFMTNVST